MPTLIRTLRQQLSRLEAQPWGSLLLRLVLAALLLYPWGWRFVPVAFGPGDVDPILVEACRTSGIDLFDPAQWLSVAQVWRRWAWILAGAALTWWGLSRLVGALQRRFGFGWAMLPALLAAAWLLKDGLPLSRWLLGHLLDASFGSGIPVWGGWIEGTVFRQVGLASHLRLLALALLGVEILMGASRTQRLLEEIRALALRSSLAPHFLYNALNTLHGLVEEDPKGAQRGLERLGRLLRGLLESSQGPRHGLAQELAFVEDYLGLERARLGERLRVAVDVPEELTACAVPVLGLQVLVENAVKHAIALRAEGGTVRIQARREGRCLILSVEDPGTGLGAGTGLGMALRNLRERLRRPKDLILERLETGHRASFRVPFEVA